MIADATPAMRVASEESFGPLAPLYRFGSDVKALALANATEFGLAIYFNSRDIGRVWRVAEGLESGMVGVNSGSNEIAPFGGVKQRAWARGFALRHRRLCDHQIYLHGLHPGACRRATIYRT